MFARGRTTIQIIELLIILVLFIGSFTAKRVNRTADHKEPLNVSIGEILPELHLQKHGNKSYYFGIIYKGNYYEALQFCNYHRMALLSIESSEENTFLWEYFLDFLGWGEYNFWTSGTVLAQGNWVWMATGTPMVYSNWAPNQPDNAGGKEKCVAVIYSRKLDTLKLNDEECVKPKHVICETL